MQKCYKVGVDNMAAKIIEVNDLCVNYKAYRNISIQKSLFKKKSENIKEIHALKNVSFSVEKGKIVGVIGKNGSGKSTLLRTVGGIFSPDQGIVNLHDHSVSLLSIGVGFINDLPGRENIFLSGMLLGFTEQEIRQYLDEIIDFSEIGEFIDYPVRTYSSGMYSRLAFSITAFLKTDILLIDELLSVGDQHFRDKSFKKMKSLISDRERTVLIVSHSIDSLRKLCDEVIWINEGELIMIGESENVLEQYRKYMEKG